MANLQEMKLGTLYKRRARINRLLNYTKRTGETIFEKDQKQYEQELSEVEKEIARRI